MISKVFDLGNNIRILPIVHGSADFALAVRDALLYERYDCVAVPLPASFQNDVMAAVEQLPKVSAVIQSCGDDSGRMSYIPVEPTQGVIRALRSARGERIACAFIGHEHQNVVDESGIYPDPYALKAASTEQYAAALTLAAHEPEPESQQDLRVRHMAFELHKLELERKRILCICPILDWPWLRDAYLERKPYPKNETYFAAIATHFVESETLSFFLGEVPYIAGLYEKGRRELVEETSLTIDGVKELLLEARDRLRRRREKVGRRITLKTLGIYLQYVRNLTLLRRRLRPDLATLVEAAKQVCGDEFAIEVIETAKDYPPQRNIGEPALRMGIGEGDIPFQGQFELVNRLPGQSFRWASIDLQRDPDLPEKTRWEQVWDPYKQCSWPPEDSRIESFNSHVREQAKLILNDDLSKVEEFSTSLKDGLDMRETLRNWHKGKLYVRERPAARGSIEIVVFLFDIPADQKRYSWQTTWFAEHDQESTLVFFATDHRSDMIGPGVARSQYGGAFFLYPPRPIPDVWLDHRLAETTTLEERLIAGAFLHSSEKHVCIVSPCPIKASWRKLARKYGKIPLHIPLGRFSASMVNRLRTFHVLNGREVRSYAANFIRKP